MKKPSRPVPASPSVDLVAGAARLLSQGQAAQALQSLMDGLPLVHADVELHNMAGVCAAAAGLPEQAEFFLRQAILLAPGDGRAYFHLGYLDEARLRPAEAQRWYEQAIARDQDHAPALGRLGLLLAMARRDTEAEAFLRRALALEPGNAAAHCNLGVLIAGQRRDGEAEQCYRQALTLAPGNAAAHSNLGILLAKVGRLDEAEQHYRSAIAARPDGAEAHANLGLLLERRKRPHEAEQSHRTALALAPGHAQIHANLANLLAASHRDIEAEQFHRSAIALDPGAASLHSNLGVLLANSGRDNEAEQYFRHAVALNPRYPLARLNLAFLLLSQGKFAEGWREHEARNDADLPDGGAPAPDFLFPRWRGESLAGKSLLIWPEQGYGDIIQFCRYVPVLKGQGASRVTLACGAPLAGLMRTLDGVDAVLAPAGPASEVGAHDYWIYAQSIPLHCDTDLASIPASIPYLFAQPEHLRRWAPRVPTAGLRVGLAWKGNPEHANDAQRSLPDLSALAPLWSLPGVQFVSLQMGREGAPAPADCHWTDLGGDIGDFADTAAIVAQLDLVISVDSAIAHLSGALGIPCCLLLPAYKTDWRWLRERDDSPWYPGVMRLFRQQTVGDWTVPVAAVARALSDKLAQR